jgi:hypothetical protein
VAGTPDPEYVKTRRVLLDALECPAPHRGEEDAGGELARPAEKALDLEGAEALGGRVVGPVPLRDPPEAGGEKLDDLRGRAGQQSWTSSPPAGPIITCCPERASPETGRTTADLRREPSRWYASTS